MAANERNAFLGALMSGFAQARDKKFGQEANEELKKLQVKLFKRQLEEQDKQREAAGRLRNLLTGVPEPGVIPEQLQVAGPEPQVLPARELEGPGRPTQTLLDILATPQGQALAMESGALTANQIARLTQEPETPFGGLFAGVPEGFEPVGFDIGPSGKPTLKFKRSELDKPLSPAELKSLRTAEGEKLPVGTTGREAEAAGARSVSAAEEAIELGQRGAQAVLGRLDELVNEVFPEGEFFERARAAPGLAATFVTQDDPNVALYESLRKGTLAPIIRAMGEKGALAEGDVQRAIELLPKLFPVPDSKEVAKRKLGQIREILSKVKGEGTETQPKQPQPPPGFRIVQ